MCGEEVEKTVDFERTYSVEGGPEIDTVEDHLRHKGVVDSSRLEDHGAVVEEVVRASELLEHLQKDTKKNSVSHARCGEHLVPFCQRITASAFRLEFGLDLFHLHVNRVVIGWGAVDT